MKIAIPLAGGLLCQHFGHCEQFAIIDIDEERKCIRQTEKVTPPPHEPGVLPRWLAEKGIELVIAGGMGARAQELFQARKIKVLTGGPVAKPEEIVAAFLAENLDLGENACSH